MGVNSAKSSLFVACLILIPLILSCSNEMANPDFDDRLAALEKQAGGRLGVAAFDSNTGRRIEYRSSERFAVSSTFKYLLVAAVLARIDEKRDSMDRSVLYSSADLLEYAPVTREHLSAGSMTVSALCAAAIEFSDNTAANLLLTTVGGPPGLTQYARSLGDSVTRLDRYEPSLNSNETGDARDTTSPAAMLQAMMKLLAGNALAPSSRIQLENWLVGNTTGATRLRTGFPVDWRVGDKTGTGANGSTNDIAIAWPPDRSPMFVAAYFTGSTIAQSERDAVLGEVGRIIASELAKRDH